MRLQTFYFLIQTVHRLVEVRIFHCHLLQLLILLFIVLSLLRRLRRKLIIKSLLPIQLGLIQGELLLVLLV